MTRPLGHRKSRPRTRRRSLILLRGGRGCRRSLRLRDRASRGTGSNPDDTGAQPWSRSRTRPRPVRRLTLSAAATTAATATAANAATAGSATATATAATTSKSCSSVHFRFALLIDCVISLWLLVLVPCFVSTMSARSSF